MGDKVIEVSASDPDKEASIISYSIKDGNLQQAFSIERQTGIIRVAKQLDYDLSTEGIRQYHLVVQAHDGKYSNDTNVRINVLNVNDMKPRFGKDKYEITLNEEEVKEHPIFKVKKKLKKK